MTIYSADGEIGGFVPSDGNVAENAAASYNGAFARAAIRAGYNFSYAEHGTTVNLTTAWVHFELKGVANQLSNNQIIFIWYDGSGNQKIRLSADNTNNNTLTLEYYNSGTGLWVTVGTITAAITGAIQIIDINANVNSATGSIQLYMSGTLRIDSGSINLSTITNLSNKYQMYGMDHTIAASYPVDYSQVIFADEPTIGMRVMTLYIVSAGSDSAWPQGNWASVNEIVYDDAAFLASDTAGQVQMMATSAVGAMTGYTVKAVCVTARGKRDSTGPQNLQLGVRVAGANYFSSTKSLGVGYGAVVNVWNTNPATGVAWLVSDLTGIQIGLKSIA